MAFLTAAELVNCYDEKRIRQLLSDTNVPISGSLDANGTLLQLIDEAEAEILAAAETGERYDETQLLNLTGSGAALLRRLCADLTFSYIVSRRGQGAADIERQCPRHNIAQRMLEQLRLGNRVFPGVEEAEQAGLPDLGNRNELKSPRTFTDVASRIFPVRQDNINRY